MKKSILRFHNAIKSEATKGRYQYKLEKFLEYVKLKEPDDAQEDPVLHRRRILYDVPWRATP